MTPLKLLLVVVGVTGATGTTPRPSSPVQSTPDVRTAGQARETAATLPAVPADARPDPSFWLARYGTYNVREGTWNFIRTDSGC